VNPSLGQIDSDEEESSSQSSHGEARVESVQTPNPFASGQNKEGPRVKIDILEGGNLKCWVSRPNSAKNSTKNSPETGTHRESKINNLDKVISKKKIYNPDTNPVLLEIKDEVNEAWNKSGNHKPGRGDFRNYSTNRSEPNDNSNLDISMISHGNAKDNQMTVDRKISFGKTENLPSSPNPPAKLNSILPIEPPPLQINLQKVGEEGVPRDYKTQNSALMHRQKKINHMHFSTNR
jgi:hypothetical protein